MNTEKAPQSLVSLYRVLSRKCWGAMGPLRLQNEQEKIENTDFSFKKFDYEGLEDERPNWRIGEPGMMSFHQMERLEQV